jgi:hypothetical protein
MLSRIKNRFLRSPLLPALLFVLVFRGVIPVGYMPGAVDSGLRLVMCSGIVLSGAGTGSAPASGAAHEGTLCPFAANALPALPAADVAMAFTPLLVGPVDAPRADSGLVFTPVRAQRARAPPLPGQIAS